VDTGEPFVALAIYPSTQPAQLGHADTLRRVAEATICRMPGFIRGRIFISEDGENVVSVVEWRDRASFTEFRQTEIGRVAAHIVGELHPKAYWLTPYAAVAAP
jgi:heme-degrading monooxygenase HmoA